MTAVWYVGTADVRLITAAQWTAAGVTGSPADSLWNLANGWSIETTAFSAGQLTILALDIAFVTNAPSGPRPGSTPYDPPLISFMTYAQLLALKGAANGIAPLGSDGKVPSGNLPSSIGSGGVTTVDGRSGTVVLSDLYLSPLSAQTFTLPQKAQARTNIGAVAQSDIDNAIANLLNGAPGALDTLKELADAIGDDASFAASINAVLATKVPNSRQINGHALTADFSLSASDVGAATAAAAATLAATLAALTAATVPYDPSTSLGYQQENNLLEGVPPFTGVSATDVQSAVDDLNRKMRAEDLFFLQLAIDLVAKTTVYPMVGSAPVTMPDGEYAPGIAGLDSSAMVPATQMGTGTPDNTKFLRGDRVWATPSVFAVRGQEWQVADNLIKATVGGQSPSVFQTATSVAASTPYLFKFFIPDGILLSNYLLWVQTAGTGTLADYYLSLFATDAAGTLIAGTATADVQAQFTSTGVKSIAIPTPVTKSGAGYIYGMLQTGTATAQPKMMAGANRLLGNLGLASAATVLPSAANAPIWGQASTGFSGTSGSKTPPATLGNGTTTGVVESASTLTFALALA